jgi:hypothetical protein
MMLDFDPMADGERISESNKTIARLLANTFQARPRIVRHWNDNRTSFVGVASVENQPEPGLVAYGTIGASDAPLMRYGKEYPARVEFVGVAEPQWDQFPCMLASAAFNVTEQQWFAAPGAVFPGIVAQHEPSVTTKHLFFVPPFLWSAELDTIDLPDRTVAWLMTIPITEGERIFAINNGTDKLEDLFDEKQVEYYDLNRASLA